MGMNLTQDTKNLLYKLQRVQPETIRGIGQAILNVFLNDPSTPELRADQATPATPPELPFTVSGYHGLGGAVSTPGGHAAQVYAVIANGLNNLSRWKIDPVKKWAAVRNLVVLPRAGKNFNAYYDRQSLRFFYGNDPLTKRIIYMCESADVVAHELGHAVLDAIRPDIWSVQALEVHAFHEAFGDIFAILNVLSSEAVVKHVIAETGGDLARSNVVSRIGEQVGAALAAMTKSPMNDCLRNAVNDFVYTPPEQLPPKGPDTALTGECHNFSRVFTGAFYSYLVEVYQKHAVTLDKVDALVRAREETARVLLNSLIHAPLTTKFFHGVAQTMVVTDYQLGLGHGPLIQKVFEARNILPPKDAVKAQSNPSLADYQKVFFGEIMVATQGGIRSGSVAGSLVLPQSTFSNPLYNLEIEVPDQDFYVYKNGVIQDAIGAKTNRSWQAAKKCLDALAVQGVVSHEADLAETPFVISGTKLERRHFCCRCSR